MKCQLFECYQLFRVTEVTAYFVGIDIGSAMTKAVIVNDGVLASVIGPTGPEHRKLANEVLEEALAKLNLSLDDIAYVVATGYGRINVPFAHKQITEISCQARGTGSLLPTVRTIIDIGGQDCKGIKVHNSKVVDFVMNDKCAAGTGRFLEVSAEGLGIKLEDMGKLSLEAKKVAEIGNTCAVFAQLEVVSKLAEGVPSEELLAGIHAAVAARIYAMLGRLKIEKEVAVTGGGAKNIGLVKALEIKFGYPVLIPPEPLLTGALGAALLGKDIALRGTSGGLSFKK